MPADVHREIGAFARQAVSSLTAVPVVMARSAKEQQINTTFRRRANGVRAEGETSVSPLRQLTHFSTATMPRLVEA